jgi:uncharacterized protein (TIGR03083 family)
MKTQPTGFAKAERISFDAMLEALQVAGDRFVALLRQLGTDDGDRPVPDLTWTVGDTAAHMLTIVRRGTGDNRRADSLAGLAELNEQGLTEVDTRVPGEIADRLAHEHATLMRMLRGFAPDRADTTVIRLHAGVHTNISSGLSYILFDFLAHGHDIARATDRPWEIDAPYAALTLHACLPILEPWVEDTTMAGHAQRQALTFPGDPDAMIVEVGDRRYRAQSQSRDEVGDAHEVDPVTTFLALAGRRPATEPASGRLASWFRSI